MEKSRRERKESGQVLVLFALMLAVLCGLVALAVDAGAIFLERRDLQKTADAAAIAGTWELPGSAALANDKAMEWAEKNGIDLNDGDEIEITVSSDHTSVTVKVTRETPFLFARVLGLTTIDVTADATAQVGSPANLSGILPFGVLESAIDYDGAPTLLKYDANDPTSGNFGALQIDGGGSNTHEHSIINGSDNAVCGLSQPSCQDPTAATQTGNMIGATRDGFNYRLDNTTENCDEFDEVLIPVVDGSYNVNATCNPFTGSTGSYRLVLVPVIDTFCVGSCDVTILYFVGAFINDQNLTGKKCQGSDCEISVTFVKVVADPTYDATLGIYDENSGVKFVRLID